MSLIDPGLLRPVERADHDLFRAAALQHPSDSCEWSFANLFLWGKVHRVEFMPFENRLLIYNRMHNICYFPIGEYLAPALLERILRESTEKGLIDAGGLYDLPEEYLRKYPEFAAAFDITADEGNFDYIYDVQKIRDMAGPRLRKKRNLIRQFERNYPAYRVEPITRDNIAVAAKLAQDLNGHLAPGEFISEENVVMRHAWENFEACKLAGILLYKDEKTSIGFSVYSDLNGHCCDVHFEKADHTVIGAPQTLVHELAKHLPPELIRMNREQDLNEPGLRQAKTTLDPLCLFRRYSARLK